MFQETNSGDRSIPAIALPDSTPSGSGETVRLMMFGSLPCVRQEIHHLHLKDYAEPNDWSRPLSTGRPNEVMVILTKRCRLN
ncbi:hypothetical protein [Almyronema epifaneia]|uniref:Uncharacterized protein n=1 Tax=Almyronema epifaneia S1 TaxID=2991925 RepID=A0ABW6IGD7_9CYAN